MGMHKYISKIRTASGKWRYIYKDVKGGPDHGHQGGPTESNSPGKFVLPSWRNSTNLKYTRDFAGTREKVASHITNGKSHRHGEAMNIVSTRHAAKKVPKSTGKASSETTGSGRSSKTTNKKKMTKFGINKTIKKTGSTPGKTGAQEAMDSFKRKTKKVGKPFKKQKATKFSRSKTEKLPKKKVRWLG